ncbi:MAG: prevent-host-death family [Planctomycetota bacterium]|nr:MAG: prevent-host-death family [Planctomycetota bacterium]
MKDTWPLQDAKNRFSEVVERALHEGPQYVTRRGKEAVVIVAVEEFRKARAPRESLFEFLQKSPLRGVRLDLRRSRDTGRRIDL